MVSNAKDLAPRPCLYTILYNQLSSYNKETSSLGSANRVIINTAICAVGSGVCVLDIMMLALQHC